MKAYTLLTSICLVSSLVSANNILANKKAKPKKPNILFFFTDDHRADALGCYGNTYIRTPNIDHLAQSGVRFNNGYVMGGHHGAISAPSRAMLLSGKHLFNVYDRLSGVETMPAYFGKFGYETFGTGKWHNESDAFEASFKHGDNVFVGGMASHYNTPCHRLEDGKLISVKTNGFSTDLFADAAIEFIDSYASTKQKNPFFCYVSFTAPHDPRSPRLDYMDLYKSGSIPLPGNFMHLHPFLYENFNIRDENLAKWPRTTNDIQQSLSEYYALISHLDSRIGDVITRLKEHKLYDNTIIVFASDNGLAMGSHGLLGKQNLYEHSTKVPIIVTGPGIPKNQVSDALIYLFDLFPTLAQLCHLDLPQNIDGLTLSKVIKGKDTAVRSSLYTVYRNTVRAVRTDEWKLISYPQRSIFQLFNLKQDPLEIIDLSELPQYRTKFNEMKSILTTWHKSVNDTTNLLPVKILNKDYDYNELNKRRWVDRHQPEYIINRYFKDLIK